MKNGRTYRSDDKGNCNQRNASSEWLRNLDGLRFGFITIPDLAKHFGDETLAIQCTAQIAVGGILDRLTCTLAIG